MYLAFIAAGSVSGWAAGLRQAQAFNVRVRDHEAVLADIGLNPADETLKRIFVDGNLLSPKIWVNYMRCHGLSLYKGKPPRPMAFVGEQFHLERVNGHEPAAAVTLPPRGEIELAGWTYDAVRVQPARGVVARIDEHYEVPLEYGLARGDIAKRTPDNRLLRVGFTGRISAETLGPGAHDIRFRVLGVDDCLVYDPAVRVSVLVER